MSTTVLRSFSNSKLADLQLIYNFASMMIFTDDLIEIIKHTFYIIRNMILTLLVAIFSSSPDIFFAYTEFSVVI